MADTGESTSPDADSWAARQRLWQRLLDGELTEVYGISGEGFTGWLMGLPPISVGAYQYNMRDGEPYSDAQREEIARQLSMEQYWYVSGEQVASNYVPRSVSAWDRQFIERAQVALIVLKTTRSELLFHRVRALLLHMRKADDSDLLARAEPDRALVKFHRRLRYYSSSIGIRRPYSYIVAAYLLERFPEKTLIVSIPQEVRQLARLRIPRP